MRTVLLILSLFSAASGNVIDRWAAAAGGREKLATIHATYREDSLEAGGHSGIVKVWETADGKYRQEVQVAGFSSLEVFDGTNGITQQGNAPAHALAGPELQRAYDSAFAATSSVFFPDRRRGSVTIEGDDVVVKPEGGTESRITIDKETGLPKTVTRRVRDRMLTLTFVSYETVDGMTFAKEIHQSGGDPRFDVVIKTAKRVINPEIDPSLFSLETKKAESNVKWPDGKHEVTVPFELAQNHIYFPASINGKPASFVYDTGAEASVVDAAHAKAMGLPTQGRVEARGAGPGSVEATMVARPTVEFGGVQVPLAVIASVPIGAISLREGREMQGIAGYDVTSHFITEIDYAKRELRFHDPASFTPSAHATAAPITFNDNTPVVKAKITTRDGRSFDVRMLVDTGARAAVVVNHPFIEKNDLTRSIGPALEGPLGLGVGGASTQKVGRLKSIEVAGFTIENPITSFSTGTSGAEANPDYEGIIGGELLRRFTVTVDYPHDRLLLEPNAALHDATEYDMSGMLVASADTKFDRVLVKNVLPDSPASNAGIQVDDELLSIDGADVKTMTLDAVRAKFLAAGQKRAITLLRSGKRVTVSLTTKTLV